MKKVRDWKKQEDYEDLRNLSSDRWAWEFLRRNPDYIEEWKNELPLETERISELLLDPDTKDAPYLEGYRTNTPESTHFIIAGRSFKYYKKWGILNLVNPNQDFPFPNPFNQRRDFKEGTARGGNIGHSKYLDDSFPNGNYISIVYDITRPLKPQFANAQKVLSEWQRDRVKQGKIRVNIIKKHKDNWIEYLRILDAKVLRVENTEIARVMFPNLSNEYPDYQGNDRVRKSLKAAEYLTKKGYREIAMAF